MTWHDPQATAVLIESGPCKPRTGHSTLKTDAGAMRLYIRNCNQNYECRLLAGKSEIGRSSWNRKSELLLDISISNCILEYKMRA